LRSFRLNLAVALQQQPSNEAVKTGAIDISRPTLAVAGRNELMRAQNYVIKMYGIIKSAMLYVTNIFEESNVRMMAILKTTLPDEIFH